MFGEGRFLSDPGPMKARVRSPGAKRAFMFAGIERVPVVSEAVANVFRSLAPDDVQLFPLTVEGEAEPFFIVNVVKVVDCIDEANCKEVHRYDEEDPFPEYAGEYRAIYGLRIAPEKIQGAGAFRLKRFKPAFVISEELKAALEAAGNLGVALERVTGPRGGQDDQRA
ncbi:imm11 family protein [Pyxidicoccus sp. 3LG]